MMREDAYDRIKELIITLQLAPGQELSETELMSRLGLGRTPIREALLRLEVEGLVKSQPRRGYWVSDITLKEIRDLFDVRRPLEETIASLACAREPQPDKFEQLERITEEMKEAVEEADVFRLVLLDREFHGALADYTDNDLLRPFAHQVYDRSLRLWVMSFQKMENFDLLVFHHKSLLPLLAKRDVEGLTRELVAHVERSTQRTLRFLAGVFGSDITPDSLFRKTR